MAIIDFNATKCKHCYKCVRNCEVKAIMIKDGRAEIMPEKCVLCGTCLQICPQSAKKLVSDLSKVKGYILSGQKVVVSIAPSYMGLLKYKTLGQVKAALKKLGFTDVRETSEGAVLVTEEYTRLLQEGKMENIITTCCPSVNDLIEIYYPQLVPYLAPVVSPMIAHGRFLKKEYGQETKVVFLGPCIAKKKESQDPRHENCIDAVLNFGEIENWLKDEDICIENCEDDPFERVNPKVNRLYPVTNGVINSVMATEGRVDSYRKFYVHGIKSCIDLFESMCRGEIKGCFIEMNNCDGGCIQGPTVEPGTVSQFKVKMDMEDAIKKDPVDSKTVAQMLVDVDMGKTFMDRSAREPMPTEEEIRAILKETGKNRPEDELNCGACGYATCRAKAAAVFQKKAEIGMCLPYALAQAESMSNIVMDVTPSMILIIDKDMRIRECNKKAMEMLGVSREEALERYIFEFIEDRDIAEVLSAKKPIIHKKMSLDTVKLKVVETIIYIDSLESVLVTYQDITKEEKAKEQHYNLKMETVEMAQKVIDKQMMVAQEIAGLLGETTAETKVTLSKLRDSILFEEED